MSRRFSHRTFFERTPNALLARYFQKRHRILREVRFERLEETEIDTILFSYWALPGALQSAIAVELRALDAMACSEGVAALVEQAEAQGDTELPMRLSELEGFHGQVLWTFLERPRYWDDAIRNHNSCSLSSVRCGPRGDLLELPAAAVQAAFGPTYRRSSLCLSSSRVSTTSA